MSKFYYDDLPFDVADKLQCLEFELQEGDITQKGYEKKKKELLEPFQDLIAEKEREYNARRLQQSQSAAIPSARDDNSEERILDDSEVVSTPIDFGPEPSAADVTDFLDFLPSPTHSLAESEKSGAALMEENHLKQTMPVQSLRPPPPHRPINNGFVNRPLPPPPMPLSAAPVRPMHMQQSIRPLGRPPPHWNQPNVRPPDPRMTPPRPMYGNNSYPVRFPINNYRPTPPPPSFVAFRPQPAFGTFRPRPLTAPPTPNHNSPSFSLQQQQQPHTRTPSLESKSDYTPSFNNRSYTPSIRQGFDPAIEQDSSDWETSSVSWRPSVGREASIMSAPSRIRQSMSVNSQLSSLDSTGPYSNRSIGRSRYKNSYTMAASFKAVAPAPQPRLSMNDPTDQALLQDLAGRQMAPIKSRSVPFTLLDSDKKTDLNSFKNLAEVLRFRSVESTGRLKEAFVMVDVRGKEPATLTWEKLNARAEKIAHTIREKGNVKQGDRVALIYRKSEVLEFIPALFGCFLAGVTAIPINVAEDLSELSFILTLTNIYLILTTDFNQKLITKEMQARSTKFPSSINWWKTNDMGTWYPPKKSPVYPPINVPEAAYIEYAKATNGELKGVVISHESIMEQCFVFQAATTETNISTEKEGEIVVEPKRVGHKPDTIVSYFEPRQQIGLIISVLHAVYAGNQTIFTCGSVIDTPAVWIYLLSKYKATIALADYTALKSITDYYQTNSKEVNTHSKKVTPDLSSLRSLIVDTHNIKPELNQYIADKLLTPLGNRDNPLEVLCPVLSLPEYGGKILSMRDNLGPAFTEELVEKEETVIENGYPVTRSVTTKQLVLAPGNSQEIFSCLFDSAALKMNKVAVLAAGAEANKVENITIRGRSHIESFGFPMANANIAIVDPETGTLCSPDTVGEIWVDSPSTKGGFWALPKHTESVFYARPITVSSETSYPEICNETYLRTGLCGTMIAGRLFILGLYEERVRQQQFGSDFGIEETYYASELLETINKRVRIEKCSIFEIFVKNQLLPIVVCEPPATKSDMTQLTTTIDEALIEYHGLRAYAIIFVGRKGLPTQLVHERRLIHPLMTKKNFLMGELNIKYIKMDVDRTIFNLATNEDPTKDVWLSRSAYEKAVRTGIIFPHPQQQHTGLDKVSSIMDGRMGCDLSQFANIVDILQRRTSLYPEDIAYVVRSYSGTNASDKPYSWKKLSYKSASIAAHLAKKGLKHGTKVLVMMPFCIEYIFCIYACLSIGVIPIPLECIDPQQQPQRITEFSELLVQVIKDLNASFILTNSTGEDVLGHKAIKNATKLCIPAKHRLPDIINISKSPKHHKTLGRESGYMVRPDWLSKDKNSPNIIFVQNASDGGCNYVYIGHDTVLNRCRVQKETCRMDSKRSIVTTGLSTFDGLGFLHAVFCGVYVGCRTIMIPTADFYANPACFFESIQRYTSKDVFITNALVQFAIKSMTANENSQIIWKGIVLKAVQNFMLVNDNRPKPLLYQDMAQRFARQKLDKEAINIVYSHMANPMITTRSYMFMEPITLSIDPYWLRQGIVRALNPEEEPYGILLNDSGIVPSNTMVAIVNPETRTICPNNAIGEIWVASDSNAKTVHNLSDAAHVQRFDATIVGNDPNIKYMRTGDIGFLWSVRRRVDNRMVHPMLEEGQCLYVLGPASEAIMQNGLIYFPVDIELSIERSHSTIAAGGSIVLQVQDEIVAVVSVKDNELAMSIIPLVVNAVLENHSLLVDTVVIVRPSNFPRSRFGDKMRKKALLSYMEKKMTALCVKRITNQHESLILPQWSQSQVSLIDPFAANNDNMSVHSVSRAQSISDFSSEFDRQSTISQHLARQDTSVSYRPKPYPESVSYAPL